MTGNVAVGVNGSPESVAAVRWAAREAALRGVSLRVIHVQERPVPPERLEHVAEWSSTPEGPVPPERSRQYEDLLQQAAGVAEQAEPGLAVVAEELVGEGLAPRALLAELETPGAVDLLVLGSQGLDSFTGFLIGTTSLPVAAASERPVVLVRTRETDSDAQGGGHTAAETGRLVLGIDLKGDEDHETVLEFGFAEAARRNSRLEILHAWTLPAMYAYAETADPGIGEELGDQISRTLSRTVEPWQKRYPDVPIQARAVVGAPGAELVYASPGAELLVVGRRKRPLPVGPRLGHVAHAVIHHAKCPVAVIPHT
ncbi:universal stress protein [Streptomyces sp. SM10]|uniref:universal stress protein n=1 Tax=Streptomyces sp. SM10 TaxID=565556 RepID=UPI000CD4CD02|nr:universal stress protein [Streptomyces sp. SM10]